METMIVPKKSKASANAAIIVLSILGVIALLVALPLLVGAVRGNTVTLKASPISHVAQMFERAGIGDEGKTTQFPDGTPCTKLSGPSAVDFGDGIVLHFYHLTCNGVTGYVNAKWVR